MIAYLVGLIANFSCEISQEADMQILAIALCLTLGWSLSAIVLQYKQRQHKDERFSEIGRAEPLMIESIRQTKGDRRNKNPFFLNLRGNLKTQSKRLQQALQKANEQLEIVLAERTAQLKQVQEKWLFERRVKRSSPGENRTSTEAAIARSESRFRGMVENSSDLISLLDFDGTIRFQSQALKRFLGYESETTIGQNAFDLIHPEDVSSLRDFLADRLLQPGRTSAIEYRMRHAEGAWIYLESVGSKLLDEPSNFQKILLNSRDITNRKQAENKMNFYSLLLNPVPQAIIAADLEGNITYWNQFAQKLYQYTFEEAIGKNFWELTISLHNQPLVCEILASLKNNGYWEGKFTAYRKDGSPCFLHVIDTIVRDSWGNLKGFLGVSEDITERKQTQEAIGQGEAILQNILETLPVDVWVTDERSVILQSNRTGEEIWEKVLPVGCDRDGKCKAFWENSSKPIAEQEWSRESAMSKHLSTDADSPEIISCNEVINIDGDRGSYKPILDSAVPLRNTQQEIIGAIFINQDISKLKRVEEALLHSEQRYRLMAENSTDLISKHTLEGVYLYASPACRRLIGYEPDELIGHCIYEFFHPDDVAAFKQTQLAVGNLPDTYTLAYRHRCKDDSYIWFETTYRTVSNPGDRNVQEIIAVSRDITERKQAEAEICALNAELEQRVILRTAQLLQTNEELTREIAERKRAEEKIRFQAHILSQVNEAVLAVDNQSRIIYWNAGAERLYHCTSEEVLGKPLQQAYRYRWLKPEDKAAALNALNSLGSWHGELINIKKTGEEIYVDISVSILKDESENQVGYLTVSRDISDRARAEEALERLSHQNELILNSAGEGICGLDLSGKITFVNPAAARMLGYEVEELIGQSIEAIADSSPPESTSDIETESSIFAAVRDGIVQSVREDVFFRPDGSSFPVEYVCTSIREQGELMGAVVIFKDISHRLAVERMKQEFISVVSHELRTPLTSMRGALGLIASGLLVSQPEKAQRMVEIAVANTDRLVRLINDILDLDRIQSGQIIMNKHICNAADLMMQAADTMQAMAQKAGVTIEVQPVEAKLWADSDRFLQTLTNLLSNAIKFSPQGTTVWVSGKVGDRIVSADETEQLLLGEKLGEFTRELIVCVKDQGRGIPPDKLETIFERFQQVNASDSRDKGGTGLGLAICRSLVQQHGGRIWAESTLGEGSCFYFTLPVN